MPGRLRLVTLMLLAAPAAAAEPPASAEDAYDAYRRMTTAVKPDCPAVTDPDEIVVCGSVDSSQHRLPRKEDSGPVIAGAADARAEREALAGGGACGGRFSHGRPGCAGGLNILAIGGAIARAIGKVAGTDQ
ncbi:hypothetical protein ACFOMD_02700 [Sphingoaurantiacus capsulatus]|uniref:Secreted protein n=1 Tax=Sphingoaurantiacus capsulatus TaxID=1771310 RepID=A0ABV7X630_9SPHN